MPFFQYTARNKQSTKLTGEMQAGSRQEVARQLNKNGITPVEINLVSVHPETPKIFPKLKLWTPNNGYLGIQSFSFGSVSGWTLVKKPQASVSWRGKLETPNPTELITFCHQMFTLMKAGVPIIRALRSLTKSDNSSLSNYLT